TYRIQGHLESEDLFLAGGKYREKQEIEEWRKLDPIARLGKFLLSKGVCTTNQLEGISERIAGVVEDSLRFAEASKAADPELTFDVMFAGQRP
ncbi:MAG TPA: thiamine pyrophosphate-dependent enzyme, partial [Candidatus Polarisedimenticolia bacterium]|nr:thiamine pyrophosphate-dependent enzyme [Candidatus Polarisedimenticolia bacterium]